MTGWKSQKWSGVESLNGEGIPARNDPSESPSRAVILIIIHFDGTKVGFLCFFTKLKHSEGKEHPQWASKIWWQKNWSVTVTYLFICCCIRPSLSLSLDVNVDPASSDTKIGGSGNNGQFSEFCTPRDNHTLSHAYSHTNALSCAHITASPTSSCLFLSALRTNPHPLPHRPSESHIHAHKHLNSNTPRPVSTFTLLSCAASL